MWFAVKNRDENTRLKSSSGGVFYALAEYVLRKKGVVFGASWSKSWLVDIIDIHKKEDIAKLMGSKYVPANLNNSYEKVKEYLEQGKLVLYSNTPCKNQALREYLGKDYENLITIDILCHGVMPLNKWTDYLKTIQRKGTQITDINLRDKTNGWHKWSVKVTYSDGYELLEEYTSNVYIKDYLSDKFLMPKCLNCKSDFKSDIIIGDYWGLPKELDDDKGLSLINIGTDKGQDIIDKIRDKIEIISVADIQTASTHNKGLRNYESKDKNKDKKPFNLTFMGRLNQQGINNQKETKEEIASEDVLGTPLIDKKCAIISLPLHKNIGGYLQSYALKRSVEKLGYKCDVINPKLSWYKDELLPFVKYINPITIKDRNSYSDILKNGYSTYIVGSDQIWRPKYNGNMVGDSFLQFVERNDVKKISYGASFGSDSWEYNNEQTELAKSLIKEFDAISVRELDGKDMCKKYLSTESTQVLDPTMLLSMEDYLILCKDVCKKQPKVFTYFLDDKEEKTKKINSIFNNNTYTNKDRDVLDCLACFRDCSYVVTDSFHGCVFSIIFNKPFICIENKARGISRFNTLKKLFGIERNFINYEDLNKLSITNFNSIIRANQTLLQQYKEKSTQWLKTSLESNKKVSYRVKRAEDIKVCLVGIGKLENNYIKEWVEHYKELGFDKIYLLDNNDIDGERFEDVISDYISSGFVELVDVRGMSNAQIQSYDKLYKDRTKMKGYDWVAMFDIDELLFLDDNKTIKELLANPIYKDFNCIAVNWKYFDDNNLVTVENNNYSMKDRFTNEYKQDLNGGRKPEYLFTKRIVRCNIPGVSINSSHGPIDRTSVNESKYNEVLTNDKVVACNIEGKKLSYNGLVLAPSDFSWNGGYLAHYRFKTIEEYVTNKMRRGYPTLYKNAGKDLNLNDFFGLNKITEDKLKWLDKHKISYDKNKLFWKK